MSLDESTFETLARDILERFMDAIDEAMGDVLDVDILGGVLTVELDSGGQYVINKHAPSRQIWVSSPVSGASHFDYDGDAGQWVSTRGGASLSELLSGELTAATGIALILR
jgi:frataxin